MAATELNRLDERLCHDVVGNITAHFDTPEFRSEFLDLVELPALRDYLMQCADGVIDGVKHPCRTLDLDELLELSWCVDETGRGETLLWRYDPALRLAFVPSVIALNRTVAPAVGNRWAAECSRKADALERSGLSLTEGVNLVIDWVEELRKYLWAFQGVEGEPVPLPPAQDASAAPAVETSQPGPAGEDDFDTLAEKQRQPAVEQAGEDDLDTTIVEQVRAAIARCGIDEQGRHRKPAAIRKEAAMNNKRCRDVLRRLANRGEYRGYTRARRR